MVFFSDLSRWLWIAVSALLMLAILGVTKIRFVLFLLFILLTGVAPASAETTDWLGVNEAMSFLEKAKRSGSKPVRLRCRSNGKLHWKLSVEMKITMAPNPGSSPWSVTIAKNALMADYWLRAEAPKSVRLISRQGLPPRPSGESAYCLLAGK